MDRKPIDRKELDRHITGNYGEDQFSKRDGGWASLRTSFWEITEWDVCSSFYPDNPYLCSGEGTGEGCPRNGQCIRAVIDNYEEE